MNTIKKKCLLIPIGIIGFLLIACNETNTPTNNTPIEPDQTVNAETNNSNQSVPVENVSQNKKTTEEVLWEAGATLAGTISDEVEKYKVKDSIRQANKDKMYAYQIGLKMHRDEAFETYHKLIDAGISSIYVFKNGRKEFYVVQFMAKEKKELMDSSEVFKTKLGEFGTEGIKVIDLDSFCLRKDIITKYPDNEIKCLKCE
jgi:hypothetical protein